MKIIVNVRQPIIIRVLEQAALGCSRWARFQDDPVLAYSGNVARLSLLRPHEAIQGESFHLNRGRLKFGLSVCAARHPTNFAIIMEGLCDPQSAGFVVQLSLFGRVVFT